MLYLDRVVASWRKFTNRRLYRRVPMDSEARILAGPLAPSVPCRATDWSPGGIFLAGEGLVPENTNVQVEFRLDELSEMPIRLTGQVVRKGKDGIAVLFTDFQESGVALLRDALIKRNLEPGYS